jgi:hypothetical protein
VVRDIPPAPPALQREDRLERWQLQRDFTGPLSVERVSGSPGLIAVHHDGKLEASPLRCSSQIRDRKAYAGALALSVQRVGPGIRYALSPRSRNRSCRHLALHSLPPRSISGICRKQCRWSGGLKLERESASEVLAILCGDAQLRQESEISQNAQQRNPAARQLRMGPAAGDLQIQQSPHTAREKTSTSSACFADPATPRVSAGRSTVHFPSPHSMCGCESTEAGLQNGSEFPASSF